MTTHLLPAGLRGIALSGPNSKHGFFAPHGRPRHVVPINVKFDRFHVGLYYLDRNVGIQPPRLLKFGILAIMLELVRSMMVRAYIYLGSYGARLFIPPPNVVARPRISKYAERKRQGSRVCASLNLKRNYG